MKRALFLAMAIFLAILLNSCGEIGPQDTPQDDTEQPTPMPEPEPEPEPEPTPEPEPEPEPEGYPTGMTVTENSYLHSDGKVTRYFLAKMDFKANPKLRFNVIKSTPKKTPSDIFKNFNTNLGTPYIISNAGYFAGSTSMSLIISNGFCDVTAPRGINWPNDENYVQTVYPVRAALGQMADGSFEIQWAYCCDPTSRKHYAFPSPLDNNEKTKQFMSEPPTADHPQAKLWEPKNAVGGGPMLVVDGKDVSTDSYWGECLDSGGTAAFSRVPRTGVGITSDGSVLLIVCDGRGMLGSPGMTLSELADTFIKHGAVKAMNFDGGGSSAIVGLGGQLLNWPSDSGSSSTPVERKVVSVISFGI